MINNQNDDDDDDDDDDDELLTNYTHFQYLLVLVISYRKSVCLPICTAMFIYFQHLGSFFSRFAPAPKRRPHVGCWPYNDTNEEGRSKKPRKYIDAKQP